MLEMLGEVYVDNLINMVFVDFLNFFVATTLKKNVEKQTIS